MKCAQIVGAVTNGGRRTHIEEALEAFNKVAEEIRLTGEYVFVYNPADYQNPNKTYEEYMYETLDSIITDKPDIFLLPGWEESAGARLEVEFAKRLGLKIKEVK